MSTPITNAKELREVEKDVAVLNVHYANLESKVDDLKDDVKELDGKIVEYSRLTKEMIESFQEENEQTHDKLFDKVSDLEKWRWMMMGAGIVIGALGWPAVTTLLGM